LQTAKYLCIGGKDEWNGVDTAMDNDYSVDDDDDDDDDNDVNCDYQCC